MPKTQHDSAKLESGAQLLRLVLMQVLELS